MIRKTLLRCTLAGLFLVGLGLVGCSDDTHRVITSSEPASIEYLATDTDFPGIDIDWEDYVSDGYYYPESQTDDEAIGDSGTPDNRFDNDDPSRKPIDNGKN